MNGADIVTETVLQSFMVGQAAKAAGQAARRSSAIGQHEAEARDALHAYSDARAKLEALKAYQAKLEDEDVQLNGKKKGKNRKDPNMPETHTGHVTKDGYLSFD